MKVTLSVRNLHPPIFICFVFVCIHRNVHRVGHLIPRNTLITIARGRIVFVRRILPLLQVVPYIAFVALRTRAAAGRFLPAVLVLM